MSTLAQVIRAREAILDGDIGFAERILYDLELDLAENLRNRASEVDESERCARGVAQVDRAVSRYRRQYEQAAPVDLQEFMRGEM
jgi:hypothetical protein